MLHAGRLSSISLCPNKITNLTLVSLMSTINNHLLLTLPVVIPYKLNGLAGYRVLLMLLNNLLALYFELVNRILFEDVYLGERSKWIVWMKCQS